MRVTESMKNLLQKFKQKKIAIVVSVTTFVLVNYPTIAFADPRTDAQAKLKNGFKDAVNSFTNVFQFVAYVVAVLALVIIGLGGMVIHDEQTLKQTKKLSTYVLIVALLVGFASTLVTLATNKTGA